MADISVFVRPGSKSFWDLTNSGKQTILRKEEKERLWTEPGRFGGIGYVIGF